MTILINHRTYNGTTLMGRGLWGNSDTTWALARAQTALASDPIITKRAWELERSGAAAFAIDRCVFSYTVSLPAAWGYNYNILSAVFRIEGISKGDTDGPGGLAKLYRNINVDIGVDAFLLANWDILLSDDEVSYDDWPADVDQYAYFNFNADGIQLLKDNIGLDILFGVRDSLYDVAGVEPTWVGGPPNITLCNWEELSTRISITAEVPDGEITVEYWDPHTATWVATTPDVYTLDDVGIRVTLTGHSAKSEPYDGRIVINIYPDEHPANVLATIDDTQAGIPDDTSCQLELTTNIPGAFELHAYYRAVVYAYVDGRNVANQGFIIANVVVDGSITSQQNWNPDTSAYQDEIPTVVADQEVGCKIIAVGYP